MSDAVEAFVGRARAATGLAIDAYEPFGFGDSPAEADELGALVAAGPKRATTGLLAGYEAEGEALPVPGAFGIVLDGAGRPLALIRTTEVTVRPFREVDAAFAWDEGEGDRSLACWQAAHRRFFGRSGLPFDDDATVVCERFELVYTED